MKNVNGPKNPAYYHGHCAGGHSCEYMIWGQMIQRCKNRNNPAFKNYGGRGIYVCEQWLNFEIFIKDMGAKPNGFTLDRIDNSKGYSPENCRWSSRAENNKNKRNNIWITLDGVSLVLSDWSKKSVVTYRTLHKRIKRGWDLKLALETPSKSK